MSYYNRALAQILRDTDPQTAQEFNAVCDAFDQTLIAKGCRAADMLCSMTRLVSSRIAQTLTGRKPN